MERNKPFSTKPASGPALSRQPSSKSNAAQTGRTKRGRGQDDDGWGGFKNYMDAKKYKLNEQFNRNGTGPTSNIFAGVAIYVNGYTIPSSDELRRLIRQHGGRYEMYLSKMRVTHIVASNLPNSKFKLMKTMLVVKPDWITDSITAGKRLSHVPYLLLGNQSKLQPGLKSFPSTTSLSRSSSTASSIRPDSAVPLAVSSDTTLGKLTKSNKDSANISFNTSENVTGDKNSTAVKDKNIPLASADDENGSEVSDDLDGDDIVYNSEEENDRNFIFDQARSSTTPSSLTLCDRSLRKRKSRVYSLKRSRNSSTGSFECLKNENSNSCDDFMNRSKSDAEQNQRDSILKFAGGKSQITKETKSLECGSTSFLDSSNLTDDSSNRTSTGTLPSGQIHSSSSLWSSSASSVLPCAQQQANLITSSDLQPVTTLPQTSTLPSVTGKTDSLSLSSKPTTASSSSPQIATGADSEKTHVLITPELHGITTTESAPLSGNHSTTASSLNMTSNDKSPRIPLTSSTSASTKTSAVSSPSKPTVTSPPKTSSAMAKAGDKNFLSEFYSNSRLHHLSTWGAEFKAYVGEIQRSGNNTFPDREKLRKAHIQNTANLGLMETLESGKCGVTGRTVMHIDMDCFFVSVGLLDRPDLRGKPVAVTHSKGQGAKLNPGSNLAWERAEWSKKRDGKLRGEKGKDATEYSSNRAVSGYDFLLDKGMTGVEAFHSMAEIASCSYEARKAGLKNGMFMGKALLLCPQLQTIPYNFAEYNRISKILYDVVASYTHDIEAVSCDEMLIDCTDVLTDTGATAMEFARVLRTEMMEKTGCPASTGIGPNILLAKLATRRAKPNGQFEVTTFEAKEFIKDQAVSDLPGVGYSMSRKLAKLGVETCGHLQNIPVSTLKREFGPKTGESLHQFSLGQDSREVKGDKQRKSVSAEVNYGIRFTKEPDAIKFLHELSGEVKRRMDAINVKGRNITLKLLVRRPDAPVETAKFMGHGICNASNKSSNLPVATNDTNLIAREVISLYRSQKVVASEIRGIGIQIHKLENTSGVIGISSRNQLSGHQSILNFAVDKNKIGSAVNTTSTEATNSTATTTATEATSANGNTKVVASSSTSIFKNFSSNTDKTNAQTSNFTTIRSNGRDAIHTDHEAVQMGKGGKSAFSKTSATCDIRESSISKDNKLLSLGKKASDRPDANTPENPSVPCTSRADQRPGPSTSRDEDPPHDFSFLTESQIDTDVLDELPNEIAQEILNDIKQRKQQRQVNAQITESDSRVANQLASDNRTNQPETITEGATNNAAVSSALPSLSQLDLSCFSALPLHLQREVKAEYARQEVTSQRSADKRAALADGNELSAPKSPLRNQGKQVAPTKPRGRGRPPGKKKLTFGTKKTKSVSSKIIGKKTVTREPNVLSTGIIISDDAEDSNSCSGFNVHRPSDVIGQSHGPEGIQDTEGRKAVINSESEQGGEKENTAVEQEEEISLCGAVLLADVRALLKEWLFSSSDPQPDDITMVTEYFTKLIQHKNLEQVHCLLRFLERSCRKLESTSWQECLVNLTSYVQSIVCAYYGLKMKL